jgi:hypothetical protein
VIGRLEKTVLDCPEPRALAASYPEVLGMRVTDAPCAPPGWRDPAHPQQEHLDIRVQDVDTAEQAVLALGASRLDAAREDGFRVFADPAGHPFCLVLG